MNDECFPEPLDPDPTPERSRESTSAFLRRSTWQGAVEMRSFYNRNLSELPVVARERLCRDLHKDRTLSKHFELVVGRFLQVLGATSIEYEAQDTSGRSVDWLAEFDDGRVSVE